MTDDPLIGRQLANFRLERLIGRGGMASVYYATDIRLNRPAAVKVIDAHFRSKETFTARFVQEARAVATWRHENIVQMYYAGDVDGLYYFAMEYIDGKTLAQILSDQASAGGLLPADDVLRYGRAIASALDYAHSKGVIHRDVKPLNVLVASDGRIVLTDFGLALDTAQGSLGEVFGSAAYTAPEQARKSNSAVPQSDLYSLGVILYQMLTGVLPFDDPSPTSVALQQITLPPPPPRQVNPNLNKAVEEVLLRSLAKLPGERFQSGAALMDALETALQGAPVPETQPARSSAPPSAVFPSRLPSWSIWLVAAIALILVIGATVVVAALGIRRSLEARSLIPTLPPSSTAVILPSASVAPALVTPVISPTVSLTPLPDASTTPLASPTLSFTTTVTLAPTSIPQAPTSTLKYSNRRRFRMYYNNTSFYMVQLSGVGDLIAGVSFERLDTSDQPTNRFSGNRWAKYSASSLLDWCFRLEIAGAGNYLRPPICEGKYMASLNPDPTDPGLFWTSQAGSTIFRVLWQNEELVRCQIAAGACEVYLP